MDIGNQIQTNYDYLKLAYSKNSEEKVTATDGNGKKITLNFNKTESFQLTAEMSKEDQTQALKEYSTKILIEAHLKANPKGPLNAYEKVSLQYEYALDVSAEIEDGFDLDYFSAENVAQRIADMAIAFSGGNIDTLNEMKSAIDKGFKAVEDILGVLPDISNDTYALIQKKLSDYENTL